MPDKRCGPARIHRTAPVFRTRTGGGVMKKYAAVSALVLFLVGCAVDPLDDLDPVSGDEGDGGNPEAIHAWVWAYTGGPDSLSVFHTIDKQCWESFRVGFRPDNGFHPAGLVGGGIYPTLWTWSGEDVVSLTNGILDHGDHGHIVHPREHVAFSAGTGFTVAGMSVTPDGSRIVVCGTFPEEQTGETISINCQTGDTVRYPAEYAVSYVVAGSDRMLTGNANSVTGTILQTEDGAHVASITTDTLVFGGVYHASTATVFLAGKTGIDVVDLQNGSIADAIDYEGDGRVTVLLAAGGSDYALGLCDAGDGSSGHVCVLDMKNRTLQRYSASGAQFAHDMDNGTVALSDDGSTAILSDLKKSVLYRITPAEGAIEQTTAPDTACPVACSHDGTRVWTLTRSKAFQVSFETNAIVDSIALPAGTTWIMVTSFRDNGALFDSNDHTF